MSIVRARYGEKGCGACWFLAVNYYFFSSVLQPATQFQVQAALATICRETAVQASGEEVDQLLAD
jgi:hypothetical protein